ncbi:hypothetical protein PROFUN_09431 [Planoprotostelium fungivorum]|uniref:Uncharacterized protein n=1 Tax=Planoprotostelium fungivorum TaxID=1890364 RepID=A0A2P6NHG9_9EUKA|nr:hypothetical protein PROFUN_09431 [Planoprotostelium fungivorum]
MENHLEVTEEPRLLSTTLGSTHCGRIQVLNKHNQWGIPSLKMDAIVGNMARTYFYVWKRIPAWSLWFLGLSDLESICRVYGSFLTKVLIRFLLCPKGEPNFFPGMLQASTISDYEFYVRCARKMRKGMDCLTNRQRSAPRGKELRTATSNVLTGPTAGAGPGRTNEWHLKRGIFSYMTQAGTRNWINALPACVANYNSSYHTTIKTSPNKLLFSEPHVERELRTSAWPLRVDLHIPVGVAPIHLILLKESSVLVGPCKSGLNQAQLFIVDLFQQFIVMASLDSDTSL